ncbi:Glucuronide carrier protein [Streptomyces sp. RB5]|uniref:Glucuronide carrier protein n=1 Tax=Streptomyces smaragdinus TaxID=2585196 RepID=A0A7K0CL22_9ACTN|nr:MFS transporter [Streptomyces smaragdinus]MQY14111.1 Glucuronide carrier protein [Streptomyces smaragdinus]
MTTTARTDQRPSARPARAGAGPSRSLLAGYASGSLVTGTFTTLPGLLLLPYLTDTLGVTAALAGAAVFAPKAWDAVLNPLAGRLSDRTRGRWGARRPYVLFGGLGVALGFLLTFAGPAHGAAGAWFCTAGFLVTATAFAFFQVPYVAMPAEITDRQEDRVRLVGGRVAVIGIAALLVGAGGPAVADAGGEGVAGYRWVGVFGCVVVAIGAVAVFAGSARAPHGTVLHSEPGLRRQFTAARGNRPFMALLRCVVAQSAATGVLLAGAPYIADHVLDGAVDVGALVAAFVAPNLLTMGLWARLGNRVGSRRGYALASLFFTAGCLLFLVAPLLPVAGVLLVMVLAGAGHAGQLLFLYAMLPDVVARSAERTGERQAGMLSGLFTTGEGLGVAMGPFVYGLVLELAGYVSSDSGGVRQSTGTRLGMLAGFAVLPSVAVVAAVLVLRSRGDREQG